LNDVGWNFWQNNNQNNNKKQETIEPTDVNPSLQIQNKPRNYWKAKGENLHFVIFYAQSTTFIIVLNS